MQTPGSIDARLTLCLPLLLCLDQVLISVLMMCQLAIHCALLQCNAWDMGSS